MHFCWETNIYKESEKSYDDVWILNCPMIIFTDSLFRYLFNNNTPSRNFFQLEHSIGRAVFTSTEAEPERTFRLKAAVSLSPEEEETEAHGAVLGP